MASRWAVSGEQHDRHRDHDGDHDRSGTSQLAERRFDEVADELSVLGREVALHLAGAGASAPLARRIGALALTADPVTCAEQVSRRVAGDRGPLAAAALARAGASL